MILLRALLLIATLSSAQSVTTTTMNTTTTTVTTTTTNTTTTVQVTSTTTKATTTVTTTTTNTTTTVTSTTTKATTTASTTTTTAAKASTTTATWSQAYCCAISCLYGYTLKPACNTIACPTTGCSNTVCCNWAQGNYSSTGFVVTSGSCTVTSSGACVQSPSFPSNYHNNEHCVIAPPAGPVAITAFDTEGCCDTLVINSYRYAGDLNQRLHNYQNLVITTPISWSSDYSISSSGWRLCRQTSNYPRRRYVSPRRRYYNPRRRYYNPRRRYYNPRRRYYTHRRRYYNPRRRYYNTPYYSHSILSNVSMTQWRLRFDNLSSWCCMKVSNVIFHSMWSNGSGYTRLMPTQALESASQYGIYQSGGAQGPVVSGLSGGGQPIWSGRTDAIGLMWIGALFPHPVNVTNVSFFMPDMSEHAGLASIDYYNGTNWIAWTTREKLVTWGNSQIFNSIGVEACTQTCSGGPCAYCDNTGCCTNDLLGASCKTPNPHATATCQGVLGQATIIPDPNPPAPPPPAPTASTILRLVGTGATSTQGRLEIYHNGEWGTVCDDSFHDIDAVVACREMGMQGGTFLGAHSYGLGSGRIWLDDVTCTGNELSLSSCYHSGWGYHNCYHAEDVAISCQAVQAPTTPDVACCSAKATCNSGYMCPAGYKMKSNPSTILCVGSAASCTKSYCCDVDTTRCLGFVGIVCPSNSYLDASKAGTLVVANQAVTYCCSLRATCAGYACPPGYTQNAGNLCSGSYTMCSTSDCCTANSNTCAGITAVPCAHANHYWDAARAINTSNGSTSAAVYCCSARASCNGYTCPTNHGWLYMNYCIGSAATCTTSACCIGTGATTCTTYPCPPGYTSNGNAANIYCNGTFATCSTSTCCDVDLTSCGGIPPVSCAKPNHFWDPAKAGTFIGAGNQTTAQAPMNYPLLLGKVTGYQAKAYEDGTGCVDFTSPADCGRIAYTLGLSTSTNPVPVMSSYGYPLGCIAVSQYTWNSPTWIVYYNNISRSPGTVSCGSSHMCLCQTIEAIGCPRGTFDGSLPSCESCSGSIRRRRALTCTTCSMRSMSTTAVAFTINFMNGTDDCLACDGEVHRRRSSSSQVQVAGLTCTPCPTGYYVDATHLLNSGYQYRLGLHALLPSCTACSWGSARRRRAIECTHCPMGWYKNWTNLTVLNNIDDCIPCSGSTRRRRSASTSAGMTTVDNTSCTPCPQGYVHQNGTDDCQVLPYKNRSTGICERYITGGLSECTVAAAYFGFSGPAVFDTPNQDDSSPPYCYFTSGGLRYNRGNGVGNCSSSHVCICHVTNGQTALGQTMSGSTTIITAPSSQWTSLPSMAVISIIGSSTCHTQAAAKAACLSDLSCTCIALAPSQSCWHLYSDHMPLSNSVYNSMITVQWLNRNAIQAGCPRRWQIHADTYTQVYGNANTTMLGFVNVNMSQILAMCQALGERRCKVFMCTSCSSSYGMSSCWYCHFYGWTSGASVTQTIYSFSYPGYITYNSTGTMCEAQKPSDWILTSGAGMGTATASAQLATGTGFSGQRAFDGLRLTNLNMWHAGLPATWVPASLQYQFASSRAIVGYEICPRRPLNDYSNFDAPKDFQFQGSNDGSSWVTLDTQTGITWNVTYNFTTQVFAITAPGSYIHYRLLVNNVVAGRVNNVKTVAISELKLYRILEQCPAGAYDLSGACTTCDGSVGRRRSAQCTACGAGMNMVNNQDDCVKCAGSVRRRRAVSCTSCAFSYYALNGSQTQAPQATQTTCGQNSCTAGYRLKPSYYTIACPMTGCTHAICCDWDPSQAFCSSFYCPAGYTLKPASAYIACPTGGCSFTICCDWYQGGRRLQGQWSTTTTGRWSTTTTSWLNYYGGHTTYPYYGGYTTYPYHAPSPSYTTYPYYGGYTTYPYHSPSPSYTTYPFNNPSIPSTYTGQGVSDNCYFCHDELNAGVCRDCGLGRWRLWVQPTTQCYACQGSVRRRRALFCSQCVTGQTGEDCQGIGISAANVSSRLSTWHQPTPQGYLLANMWSGAYIYVVFDMQTWVAAGSVDEWALFDFGLHVHLIEVGIESSVADPCNPGAMRFEIGTSQSGPFTSVFSFQRPQMSGMSSYPVNTTTRFFRIFIASAAIPYSCSNGPMRDLSYVAFRLRPEGMVNHFTDEWLNDQVTMAADPHANVIIAALDYTGLSTSTWGLRVLGPLQWLDLTTGMYAVGSYVGKVPFDSMDAILSMMSQANMPAASLLHPSLAPTITQVSACNTPGQYLSRSGTGYSSSASCSHCYGSVRRRRALHCTQCPPGSYNFAGGDLCNQTCDGSVRRRYYSHYGSSSGYAYYNNYLSCTPCPIDEYAVVDASDPGSSYCRKCDGSIRRRRADYCTRCPYGKYSFVNNNYYANGTSYQTYKDCNNTCAGSVRRRVSWYSSYSTSYYSSSVCTLCPVGYSIETATGTNCVYCFGDATRRRAVACTECSPGKYLAPTWYDRDDRCASCTGSVRRRRAQSCSPCVYPAIKSQGAKDDCDYPAGYTHTASTTGYQHWRTSSTTTTRMWGHQTTTRNLSAATGVCPAATPYAFLSGQRCCRANLEQTYAPDGAACDGSALSWSSTCCEGDEWVPCSSPGGCVNHQHASTTFCSNLVCKFPHACGICMMTMNDAAKCCPLGQAASTTHVYDNLGPGWCVASTSSSSNPQYPNAWVSDAPFTSSMCKLLCSSYSHCLGCMDALDYITHLLLDEVLRSSVQYVPLLNGTFPGPCVLFTTSASQPPWGWSFIQGTGATSIDDSYRLGGLSQWVGNLSYHNYSCWRRSQAISFTTTTSTTKLVTTTTTTTMKLVATMVTQELTFNGLSNYSTASSLTSAYQNAVAQATGTSTNAVSQVQVSEIKISAQYGGFPNNITVAQAQQAIALSVGVNASQVTVVLSQVLRRLTNSEARRLSMTAQAQIRVTSGMSTSSGTDIVQMAQQIQAQSTNMTSMGSTLSQVTGTSVAPTVSQAPSVKVVLSAQVVTTSNTGGATLQNMLSSNAVASSVGASQAVVMSAVVATSSTSTTTQGTTTTVSAGNATSTTVTQTLDITTSGGKGTTSVKIAAAMSLLVVPMISFARVQ